jgi:putative ribosome biogenesis GTPase RsgA
MKTFQLLISKKLLSISGAAGIYITQYLSSENYYRRRAETRLLFGVKVVEPAQYIERGEIEEELNRLFGQVPPNKYYIIAGPTGSGKTSLIKHVVSGKNAVIMFGVDETTGLLVAQQKILSELGINAAQFSIRKAF